MRDRGPEAIDGSSSHASRARVPCRAGFVSAGRASCLPGGLRVCRAGFVSAGRASCLPGRGSWRACTTLPDLATLADLDYVWPAEDTGRTQVARRVKAKMGLDDRSAIPAHG